MRQAGPLPQATAGGLQVQTRLQAARATHEERDSEQNEHEVEYSLRAEETQFGVPNGKRSHKETTVETRLDVLEASLEELYQGQGRILGVESSLKEAKYQIDRVESLVDRLTEDSKDFVRHLHEVVTELMTKVTMERVPECVLVSICTEPGCRSAEADAIEKSLPTARVLRCDKTCTVLVAEMVVVHVASVCEEGVEKCWSWHLP
ncbi:hypothetical protein BHM03_00050601 [Ensete ventricosum]|nr:hypothetical protein BHM03_00050601 [Ensete ventricosum]